MEKTLYYKAVIRERTKRKNIVKNEGFLIARLEDNELVSLEGAFTFDYVTMEIIGDKALLKYYTREHILDEYEQEWEIELSKEIEWPFNMQAFFHFQIEEKIVPGIIELKTMYNISKPEEQSACEKQLSEAKDVFKKERN